MRAFTDSFPYSCGQKYEIPWNVSGIISGSITRIMWSFCSPVLFFGEFSCVFLALRLWILTQKYLISLSVSFLAHCMYLAVPTAPPQEVKVINITTVSVQLEWKPPPQREQNGRIRGYKVLWEQLFIALHSQHAVLFDTDGCFSSYLKKLSSHVRRSLKKEERRKYSEISMISQTLDFSSLPITRSKKSFPFPQSNPISRTTRFFKPIWRYEESGFNCIEKTISMIVKESHNVA